MKRYIVPLVAAALLLVGIGTESHAAIVVADSQHASHSDLTPWGALDLNVAGTAVPDIVEVMVKVMLTASGTIELTAQTDSTIEDIQVGGELDPLTGPAGINTVLAATEVLAPPDIVLLGGESTGVLDFNATSSQMFTFTTPVDIAAFTGGSVFTATADGKLLLGVVGGNVDSVQVTNVGVEIWVEFKIDDSIPEPSTFIIAALAMIGLAWNRRRR